jgi:hypothetical protein
MLFMAHRGIDDDQRLFSLTFPDLQRNPPWSDEEPIPDRGSLVGPAMAVFQGQLFMAWRGIIGDDSDRRLFFATNDGTGWSPQTVLGDRGSNYGPALAAFRDKLYMAWRGVEDDQRLFWATFPDPTKNPPWSDQHSLDDRGSRAGPSLAVFRDQLFMAWRGIEGDEHLFWSTFDGQGWSDQHRLGDRISIEGPALAVLGDHLYMFWRGGIGIDEADLRVFFSVFQGGTGDDAWSPQKPVQAPNGAFLGSSSRPGVTAFINKLFVVTVGSATFNVIGNPDTDDTIHLGGSPPDFRIFFTTFDGANGSFPTLIPGIGTVFEPALCVFAKPPNSLRQYLKGFDLSKGIRSIAPGVSSVRSMMGL